MILAYGIGSTLTQALQDRQDLLRRWIKLFDNFQSVRQRAVAGKNERATARDPLAVVRLRAVRCYPRSTRRSLVREKKVAANRASFSALARSTSLFTTPTSVTFPFFTMM